MGCLPRSPSDDPACPSRGSTRVPAALANCQRDMTELVRCPAQTWAEKHSRSQATARDLRLADFYIVTVPTPIDASKQPNLEPLRQASSTVGQVLKKGDIVVYELTVYPGVTEDVCIPVLEKASGLKWKTDFNVGYSPERINPGDKERRFDNILKIVSADTPETLDNRRRRLQKRRHRGHTPRLVDSRRRVRQSAGEHPARHQHRPDQRGRADLRPAGHRHARRARGGRHQVELPALQARAWSAATASASIRSTSPTRPRKWATTRTSSIRAGASTTAWASMSPTASPARSCGAPATAIRSSPCWASPSRRTCPTSATRASSTSFASWRISASPSSCTTRRPTAISCREEYQLTLTPLEKLQPADAVVLAVAHASYRKGGWDLIKPLLRSRRLRRRRPRAARPHIDAKGHNAVAPVGRLQGSLSMTRKTASTATILIRTGTIATIVRCAGNANPT